MIKKIPFAKHRAGIGLVDLLVGLAISLLAMLVILQIAVLFEARRKTTTGGADAQMRGIHVIATIERDLRLAGYGLGPSEALGCAVKRHFVTPQTDLILQPVRIANGINGAPDSLQILASAKSGGGVAAQLSSDHANDADQMMVNSTLDILTNDILIIQEAGKPCTMVQATAVPTGQFRVSHEGVRSAWNPDAPATLFPLAGYRIGAAVINLGAVSDRGYAVDTNGQLQLSRYLSVSNTTATTPLATNIVNLQAQYGFDTRAGLQTSSQVTRWSATMIDADGNGVAGDNGDLRRLLAVRVAVVARSSQAEPAIARCTTTTSQPTWQAGDVVDGQLVDTLIAIDRNPDGSANANWRCFSYRVFDTVVPLRNLLWSPV